MALYDYLCEVCNEEFEAEHSIKSVLEECTLCKEAGRENHIPKRLISLCGKGVVEQTVADIKANMPNEIRKINKRAMTDPYFAANFIGKNYTGE